MFGLGTAPPSLVSTVDARAWGGWVVRWVVQRWRVGRRYWSQLLLFSTFYPAQNPTNQRYLEEGDQQAGESPRSRRTERGSSTNTNTKKLERSAHTQMEQTHQCMEEEPQLTSIPHSRANSWLELMTNSLSLSLSPQHHRVLSPSYFLEPRNDFRSRSLNDGGESNSVSSSIPWIPVESVA